MAVKGFGFSRVTVRGFFLVLVWGKKRRLFFVCSGLYEGKCFIDLKEGFLDPLGPLNE